MKFAVLGHLINKNDFEKIPKNWLYKNWIISPEYKFNNISGFFTSLKYTPLEFMTLSKQETREKILELALVLQDDFDVNLIQLGGLISSFTKGGKWLSEQSEYHRFINHGNSYTASVILDSVKKILDLMDLDSHHLTISIVGAYGIIGETISKFLTPDFNYTILIGREKNKFNNLISNLNGNYEITTELNTDNSDIIVTVTNHPSSLLKSKNLKKGAIIIDVSQPPNLSKNTINDRPDVIRIDGGLIDFPYDVKIPTLPPKKIFACIAEVIMQAMEGIERNYVGSIDVNHLEETRLWGKKYNIKLNDFTNFGQKIELIESINNFR